MRSTRMNVSSSRTSCGTSFRSFPFVFGRLGRRLLDSYLGAMAGRGEYSNEYIC
jgi:hypothetical protein